jgi:predicted enzyme related to lactoylglutathione lyase
MLANHYYRIATMERQEPSSRKIAAAPAAADAAPSSTLSHVPTRGLYGWITHTDLASNDPAATKAWCAEVLGWTFTASFPTPEGEYHLFAYSERGGGGIRKINPSEVPGSLPYVHVEDAQAAFEKAIREGAEEMLAPTRVMEGVTVAIVRAPGGVPIGFSGP